MSSAPEFRYRIEATAAAPIEVVFATVVDQASYADWSSCDESFLELQGDPAPNGFGAIRVVRDKSKDVVIDIREVVNHYWPPYLFGYRALNATIVRDHQGVVLLESLGAASTKVIWHSTSSPVDSALSEVLGDQLGAGIRQLVDDVCAEATRRHHASTPA